MCALKRRHNSHHPRRIFHPVLEPYYMYYFFFIFYFVLISSGLRYFSYRLELSGPDVSSITDKNVCTAIAQDN
jgi:hypothetical protein